jgi:hypothetical protein
MSETLWFSRFGDIPNIEYATPPDVRPPSLPARELKPVIHTHDWDGSPSESLWWEDGEGSTGASPAARWRSTGRDSRQEPLAHIRRRTYEALELPGTPSDYHFLLQGGYRSLLDRGRRDPQILAVVEHLCLLDIALAENVPTALTLGRDDVSPLPVLGFGILIELYERNGFLHDALVIARRAAATGRENEAANRLESRIAALRAEDD